MVSEQAVREALPAAPRLHVAQLKKPFPVRGRPAESLKKHRATIDKIKQNQSESLSESFKTNSFSLTISMHFRCTSADLGPPQGLDDAGCRSAQGAVSHRFSIFELRRFRKLSMPLSILGVLTIDSIDIELLSPFVSSLLSFFLSLHLLK
jgi:hypothetical protein